ncbi:MAG: isoleucine--tRNA ligase, partial [Patescibacteria group bacterium]
MAKRKPYFVPVDTKVDFPKMERGVLDYWYKAGIVKKYLSKNKSSKKRFSFLDGPITANNPMGVHHAWGRTYKDLWQRYYNMQGYRQRFQNGFDCQGLWVEVEVEKELGLKSKKDIENLVSGDVKKSIARFVELCKKRVYKYADIQTEQSKRLGYFMDWDNSYYTLSDENNYMIWHFLKKCANLGLIYKGRDSVPWCPRCGTAISQHEILTEDYQELTHDAIFVSFSINDRKGEYLLIWTTTPWTLPANVAVAVNPKLDYVLAKDVKSGKSFYLLENVAKNLGLKIVKKLKGSKLVGLTYNSPFDNFTRVKEKLGKYKHRVVKSDERILAVSTEEGTGLVHIATGAGSEDFALGKKEKLPVIDVIDEEAVYLSGLAEFTGRNAKDNPQLIIEYLEQERSLFKKHRFRHRYPVCWRCKKELVWRVVDEWYISMDKPLNPKLKTQSSKPKTLRNQMVEVAKKINWIPGFGLERELDWLKNMHDWLISKKRYWGLALPIWECKECGHFDVIGGREELEKRAAEGWDKFEGSTPHRPWVDEVKIKCSKCGALAERIKDVGSPWLDAGIVPYSTIAKDNKGAPLYKKDKSKWRKWFPADFITESFPGQFKNWFYAMIAESTILENREPYRTVLGFATLFGEDGKAMHKSLGNAIEFNEGADKIGVDVMRWMYVRQDPEHNLLFGYKKADEVRRRFHLKVWNIYNFFITYANADGWSPSVPDPRFREPHGSVKALKGRRPVALKQSSVLDRWIVSRLNQTIKEVTKNLEDYDAYRASEEIEEFVEDLSNW